MIRFNVCLIITFFLISSLTTKAQWQECTGEHAHLNVYGFIQINDDLLGCTPKGIIISKDYVTWNELIEFNFPITSLYYFENILFGTFGYNALRVVYSKDNHKTWQTLNTDTLKNFTTNLFSLLYDNGNIFVATGKGIFKTSDWGEKWVLVSTNIIGNNTIHSKILKKGNIYFASDKNKDLFISKDFGQTWEIVEKGNINSGTIILKNDHLFGFKDGKFVYRLNADYKWESYIDKEFGFISGISSLCCNGLFISSKKNCISFGKNTLITLPKIPIDKEYDLCQASFISDQYIVVSIIDRGIWFMPYKLSIVYE